MAINKFVNRNKIHWHYFYVSAPFPRFSFFFIFFLHILAPNGVPPIHSHTDNHIQEDESQGVLLVGTQPPQNCLKVFMNENFSRPFALYVYILY